MNGMNARTGLALKSELESIRQSLADILMTPIGSRIARRDYGSHLPRLLDQPLSGEITLMLYAAATIAIMQWEKRVRPTRLSLTHEGEAGAALGIACDIDSGKQHDFLVPLTMGRAA